MFAGWELYWTLSYHVTELGDMTLTNHRRVIILDDTRKFFVAIFGPLLSPVPSHVQSDHSWWPKFFVAIIHCHQCHHKYSDHSWRLKFFVAATHCYQCQSQVLSDHSWWSKFSAATIGPLLPPAPTTSPRRSKSSRQWPAMSAWCGPTMDESVMDRGHMANVRTD